MPLSVEHRWVLIWRMVELDIGPAGADHRDLLTSAAARDRSAQAEDWAARARAAAPDPDEQSAAWTTVERPDLSNRRLEAVLDGLWSSGRGSLPDEQVTTYLRRAPALAARRGPGFAALLGSCHPGLALDEAQAQILSDVLDGPLEPRLRRQWQDWADDLAAGSPAAT